jgi:lipoprotein-releasing system permease protein
MPTRLLKRIAVRFETFIAWKHLTRRRKSGFISLISLISTAGIAIGVMALFFVLGVMSGLDRVLKTKIVSVQPHLSIEKYGGVDDPEGDIQTLKTLGMTSIVSISAYVEGQAILRSESNALGVVVKGLDAEHEDLAMYRQNILKGAIDLSETPVKVSKKRFSFFRKNVADREGGLLIGDALAGYLNVHVGDQVQLISPQAGDAATAVLEGSTSIRTFRVRGIFRMGMSDFDSGLALIDLHQAQDLYQLGARVTGISLRFNHIDDAQKWRLLVQSTFASGYVVRSWYDRNENFFQALKVEKAVMTILLTLIVMVAAFNIISTLIMVVMEKTRDIGVMRALGATSGIFLSCRGSQSVVSVYFLARLGDWPWPSI